jgi:hypothetical protein
VLGSILSKHVRMLMIFAVTSASVGPAAAPPMNRLLPSTTIGALKILNMRCGGEGGYHIQQHHHVERSTCTNSTYASIRITRCAATCLIMGCIAFLHPIIHVPSPHSSAYVRQLSPHTHTHTHARERESRVAASSMVPPLEAALHTLLQTQHTLRMCARSGAATEMTQL